MQVHKSSPSDAIQTNKRKTMTPASRPSTSPPPHFTPFASSHRPLGSDGIDDAEDDGDYDHDVNSLSRREPEPTTSTTAAASATTTSASLPSTTHAILWDASDPRINSIDSPAEGANDIEMEPMKGTGHRRRRSSLMQSVGSNYNSSTNNITGGRSRADSIRAPGIGLSEEPKIPEEQADDLHLRSPDSDYDSLSDEDLHDDEETGLSKKDRRRKRRKRRRNTLLDQRIVRGGEISAEEKKAADQSVVKSLLINSALILAWYFFSLSISLVRLQIFPLCFP